MSPMSAANARRKSSRYSRRSILRCCALVDVGAVLVEEPDLDAVGIVGREPHRDPALRPLAAHLEAGDRHGRELEVHHVHAAQVEARDDRPLERAGDAARVAARAHDRALLERGAVGHREADRDLRRDVDVGEAAHAAPAEQRAGALALPHDRRRDERAGLDRLERVDLHPGIDDRPRADEALVADHDAFLDVRVLADVVGPADHRAAQPRRVADVAVVVHDRALEMRVGLHDDVGAEHRVRARAPRPPRRGSCRRRAPGPR